MKPQCPQCHTTFDRAGSSQAVFSCRSCSRVWLHREALRRFVRDAINASGVAKKVIGFTETPGRATDLGCPGCAVAMQSTLLRGVTALRCSTCDYVLVDQAGLTEIVRRVIEAEVGWKAAEAEWADLYAQMKLEAARSGLSAADAETTGLLLGLLGR